MSFGSFDGPSVSIGLSEGTPGETGTVGAFVRYTNEGGAEWTARDCTLELTTNELLESDPEFADTYLLAGTGVCNENASPTSGGGDAELIIGDFSFSNNQVPWRE